MKINNTMLLLQQHHCIVNVHDFYSIEVEQCTNIIMYTDICFSCCYIEGCQPSDLLPPLPLPTPINPSFSLSPLNQSSQITLQ